MLLLIVRLVVGAVVFSSTIAWAIEKQESLPINPSLLRFHRQYSEPRLVRVSPHVHAAFAYEYSNFGFIEGPDGVIVVDSGWYPGPAKQALADYRKLTDKPIWALIFTHPHLDHIGGSAALLEGSDETVVVVGHVGWDERTDDLSLLPGLEAQRRLLPLLGGSDKVLSAATNAMEEGDYRWALRNGVFAPSFTTSAARVSAWFTTTTNLFLSAR